MLLVTRTSAWRTFISAPGSQAASATGAPSRGSTQDARSPGGTCSPGTRLGPPHASPRTHLTPHMTRPTTRWDPPEVCGMVTSLTGRAGGACGLPAPPGTGCMCLPVGQEGDQPRPHTSRRLQTPARAPAANGLLLRSTLALALDVSFHGAAGARTVRGRPGLHPASAGSPGGERRPRGAVHRSGRQEPGRSLGRGSAAYGVTLGKLQTCSVPLLP